MTVTIDPNASVQFCSCPVTGEGYPRQIVVDFGRQELRFGIDMHGLLHWTAYRIDTFVGNRRLAGVLRGIADTYFAFEDEADYLIADMRDEGNTEDFDFPEPSVPTVDPRLLELEDGLVYISGSFSEVLWEGQAPHPVLQRNEGEKMDFMLPELIADRHGIRGIRVSVLDLVSWIAGPRQRNVLSFQSLDHWVDHLDETAVASREAHLLYREERFAKILAAAKARPKDTGSMAPPSAAEQDSMLAELSALI